jgi:hypothetical protein
MSSPNTLEKVHTLWNHMHDPARAGVPALIAFRRYRRALKKLDAAGNAPSDIPRYSETAAGEFRLTHLLRAADNAVAKIWSDRLSGNALQNEVKKLNHFVNKANVGWQAIGLTPLNVLEFEVLIFKKRAQELSDDKDEQVISQRQDTLSYYYQQHKDIITRSAQSLGISEFDGRDLLAGLKNAYEQYASAFKDSELDRVVQIRCRLLAGEIIDKKEITQSIYTLRGQAFPAKEFEEKTGTSLHVFEHALRKEERRLEIIDLKGIFESAMSGGNTHEALGRRIEAIETLENRELPALDASWEDIGQTETAVEKIKHDTNSALAVSYFTQAEAEVDSGENGALNKASAHFTMACFCLNETGKTWKVFGIDDMRLQKMTERIPSPNFL